MKHYWTQRKPKTALTILTGAAYATILSFTMVGASIVTAASIKDADRGRAAFEKRCTGCHDLDKIKVGPPLRGIYGRTAGKDSHFAYSDAMKSSSVTWDESTLDRWLTDTDGFIPDNDMAFRLNDPVDRANIVAYLRQLSGK